mmetsp:Transcript_27545/g.85712  ORF Transcript_27545/g.85712 Transcript_27545/m.85712 type:complete len:227 (-) Transcript_27545:18-698(-)
MARRPACDGHRQHLPWWRVDGQGPGWAAFWGLLPQRQAAHHLPSHGPRRDSPPPGARAALRRGPLHLLQVWLQGCLPVRLRPFLHEVHHQQTEAGGAVFCRGVRLGDRRQRGLALGRRGAPGLCRVCTGALRAQDRPARLPEGLPQGWGDPGGDLRLHAAGPLRLPAGPRLAAAADREGARGHLERAPPAGCARARPLRERRRRRGRLSRGRAHQRGMGDQQQTNE